MRYKLCLASLCLLFLVEYTLSLPNPTCHYDPQVLSCKEHNLEIPNNFDVNAIPQDVSQITLDCPRGSQPDVYCNVMKRSARPFPQLPYLETVSLYGFQGEDGQRFLLNVLLWNVKPNIKSLDVRHSRIGRLDAEYLKGFSALRELTIGGNDITEIAPNTFQLLSSSSPVLREVHLGHNRISTLDWGVWQPVANSLTDIGLSNQSPGLRSLYLRPRTPTFSLNKLNKMSLNNNKLQSIPRQILDTMTTFQDSENHFDLKDNSFCPANPDCSCNELRSFFNWVTSVQRTASPGVEADFIVNCGSGDRACQHRLVVENSAFTYSVGRQGDNALQDAQFDGGQRFMQCDSLEPIYTTAAPYYPAGESDPSGAPYPDEGAYPGGHFPPGGPVFPGGSLPSGGAFPSGFGSSSSGWGPNHPVGGILQQLAAVLPDSLAILHPSKLESQVMFEEEFPTGAGFNPAGSLQPERQYPDGGYHPEEPFAPGPVMPPIAQYHPEDAILPGHDSSSPGQDPSVGMESGAVSSGASPDSVAGPADTPAPVPESGILAAGAPGGAAGSPAVSTVVAATVPPAPAVAPATTVRPVATTGRAGRTIAIFSEVVLALAVGYLLL